MLIFAALAGVVCIACAALLAWRYLHPPLGEYDPQPVQGTAQVCMPDTLDAQLLQMEEEDIHRGDLILVNADTPCTFADSTDDMVRIYDHKTGSYQVRTTQLFWMPQAMEPLNDLLDGFYAQYSDRAVNIISTYRSYDDQQQLYDQRVQQEGEAAAKAYVAPAGASEHHTGLAMDLSLYLEGGRSLDFTGSGRYAWIGDNAYRYGFILRYPEEKRELTGIAYEPWHFRYVGRVHATAMRALGLCMEEYIDLLHGCTYEGEHLLVTCDDGSRYEVYYAEGLEVPVPKDADYTVSGDNIAGFIVTVALDADAA